MTAEQQKAKDLIEKVGTKEHAIVCVDEMLESFKDVNYGLNNIYQDIRTPKTISQHTNNYLKFWQKVKQEIINYK